MQRGIATPIPWPHADIESVLNFAGKSRDVERARPALTKLRSSSEGTAGPAP